MPRFAHTNDDLRIGTTLIRTGADGQPVACDVTVNFSATMTHRGYPATWTDPAEAPEFETEFTGAEFDGGEPDDAPGPITAIEIETLRKWFDEHEGKAWECANDNFHFGDAA